ncbi:MAG: GGDEF domain-containing protein [Gallionella sp.]|nr:GGDEF domain-containing protein [Gallionella sp.]
MLVVAGALWVIQSNSYMVEQYQLRDGNLIAEGLANAVAADLVRRDYGALEGRLLQTASDPSVRSALVIDMQGQVLGYVKGRSSDVPAHPVFYLQKITPPHAEHMQAEMHPDFLSIGHIVKVGIDVGWVRVDIATNYYAQSMDKVKREVWALALVVMVAGFFLLGAAIFRSHKLLHQRAAEVENRQQLLEDKAYYDALTQLPNRSLLFDRITQAIAHNARNQRLLAVCFVDLDKFKPINDELGHQVGDLLLKEAAKRMQDCVRESDTVARIGGDEFVVLLPDIETEQDALLVAEKIREALNQPFLLGGKSLGISSSTGVALFPEHGEDETELMRHADTAMYRAKTGGRNRVVLYQRDMLAHKL